MALLTRGALKSLFKRGNVPTEVNFGDLIDSTVNKIDDGFAQSATEGFMLSPKGPDQKLMSFFESMRDSNAAFSMSMNPNRHSQGLSFNDSEGNSSLFLRQGGNIGIGTTLPNFKMEVDGTIASKGRIGTFKHGDVLADANWHPIVKELSGIQAFEIIAYVGGRPGRGKYALTHAIALCTHGKGKITQIKTSYGWFWQKIKFRWRGNENEFQLEMKSSGNYGFMDDDGKERVKIKYYVTQLWDERLIEHINSK